MKCALFSRPILPVFTLGSLCLALPAMALLERIPVAEFSRGILDGWEQRIFSGETRYRLTATEQGRVLEAVTEGAASGLYRMISVDLDKTPWLNWSWRVDSVYQGLNEREKSGDDYPARIYVVDSGGIRFWNTRALNYVWSNSQPLETVWGSAYAANSQMIAVDSGMDALGEWRRHKRNVRADFQRIFGDDVNKIHGIALMTDSDDAGQSSRAFYGDIYFTAE